MSKARRLITNLSKGELSPLLEGRPDLSSYFEGAKTLENWRILRQGGVTRRVGTRFVREVKTSAKDTILLPFVFSVSQSYILEVGDLYLRFYKNGAVILTSAGGPPVEVVSPYTEAQLRDIHFAQSADVMWLFHPSHQQRRLSRVSDTSWSPSAITYTPPPSFEADTDISGGSATLTLAATSGTGVIVTASSAVFLEADVGRQLIIGAGRAVIVAFGASAGDTTSPNDNVRIDVLDTFSGTGPHAAGTWLLRLSPQATLDPDKKEPVGVQVTLVAGTPTFRTADVGKFIHIYGGVVKITVRDSATQVKGTLQSVMGETTDANPVAAPAGSWTLEEASWSASRGFPRTGEFFSGRLAQGGTASQPTTWWLSGSDDFDNYAVGTFADNAVEYTIASRQINQIEWLADQIDLFIGTAGAEVRARGGTADQPIGGDVIPLVQKQDDIGSAHIQANVSGRHTIFVDRSLRKILALGFNWEVDGFDINELTDIAEHITGTDGLRLGHVAFARRPDPTLYFVRSDGQLVALTFFPRQRVIGFARFVTDGTFESVAAIPTASGRDQVWVIAKRTINGQTKRYVEYFEDNVTGLTGRTWTSLQTDSAIIYDGSATTTITGLSHLEAKTVDVVADAGFVGTKVVSGGQITLDTAATEVEVGLHFESKAVTMRPSIEGAVIEGIPRSLDKIGIRLKDTIGGKVNGEFLQYVPSDLDELGVFTGDRDVTGQGWDTEGRVTFEQTQPYPMSVLCIFYTLSLGDTD